MCENDMADVDYTHYNYFICNETSYTHWNFQNHTNWDCQGMTNQNAMIIKEGCNQTTNLYYNITDCHYTT